MECTSHHPAIHHTNLKVKIFSAEIFYIKFLDILTVTTHPVHIPKEKGEISPSAFIPFCEFGGNMLAMGEISDSFHDPVCNSFQPAILNEQLCYEIDLNNFSRKDNIENELKLGFAFVMNYNEDRQVSNDKIVETNQVNGLVRKLVKFDEDQHAFIHLNTIGTHNTQFINISSFHIKR